MATGVLMLLPAGVVECGVRIDIVGVGSAVLLIATEIIATRQIAYTKTLNRQDIERCASSCSVPAPQCPIRIVTTQEYLLQCATGIICSTADTEPPTRWSRQA